MDFDALPSLAAIPKMPKKKRRKNGEFLKTDADLHTDLVALHLLHGESASAFCDSSPRFSFVSSSAQCFKLRSPVFGFQNLILINFPPFFPVISFNRSVSLKMNQCLNAVRHSGFPPSRASDCETKTSLLSKLESDRLRSPRVVLTRNHPLIQRNGRISTLSVEICVYQQYYSSVLSEIVTDGESRIAEI